MTKKIGTTDIYNKNNSTVMWDTFSLNYEIIYSIFLTSHPRAAHNVKPTSNDSYINCTFYPINSQRFHLCC